MVGRRSVFRLPIGFFDKFSGVNCETLVFLFCGILFCSADQVSARLTRSYCDLPRGWCWHPLWKRQFLRPAAKNGAGHEGQCNRQSGQCRIRGFSLASWGDTHTHIFLFQRAVECPLQSLNNTCFSNDVIWFDDMNDVSKSKPKPV